MQEYSKVFKIIWPKYRYIYSPVIGLHFRNTYDVRTVTMVTPEQWEKNKNNSVCQLSVKLSRWPAFLFRYFKASLVLNFTYKY